MAFDISGHSLIFSFRFHCVVFVFLVWPNMDVNEGSKCVFKAAQN